MFAVLMLSATFFCTAIDWNRGLLLRIVTTILKVIFLNKLILMVSVRVIGIYASRFNIFRCTSYLL